MIDHQAIARMVPHSGEMCLLDRVLAWTPHRIHCAAESHRSDTNPMRRAGQLGGLCGVEYASQAMALHGALCGGALAQGAMPEEAVSEGTMAEGSVTGRTGVAHTPRAAPEVGFLASVRALTCHVARLDDLEGTLEVIADRLHGEATRVMYGFVLRHRERVLLEGRAAVVIGGLVP